MEEGKPTYYSPISSEGVYVLISFQLSYCPSWTQPSTAYPNAILKPISAISNTGKIIHLFLSIKSKTGENGTTTFLPTLEGPFVAVVREMIVGGVSFQSVVYVVRH